MTSEITESVKDINAFIDKLNKGESLEKINRITLLNPIPVNVKPTDLVICIRSLFEFPLDITLNTVQVATKTGIEFKSQRALFAECETDSGWKLGPCNFMGILRGKENLFGLTKDDKNLATYNAARLTKYTNRIHDITQINDSVVESSLYSDVVSHQVINGPYVEYQYIEYGFPIKVLGTKTVTAGSKSGEVCVINNAHENQIFVRQYIKCNDMPAKHTTFGLYVTLNESAKINDKRMAIIKDIISKLNSII
jgi:hypothetical protein